MGISTKVEVLLRADYVSYSPTYIKTQQINYCFNHVSRYVVLRACVSTLRTYGDRELKGVGV